MNEPIEATSPLAAQMIAAGHAVVELARPQRCIRCFDWRICVVELPGIGKLCNDCYLQLMGIGMVE